MKRQASDPLRLWSIAILSLAAMLSWPGVGTAATLDDIRDAKSIRIAYREDAPPFSYKGGDGQPTGFMIDLCRMVVHRIAQQFKLTDIGLLYVPVTAIDRFEAIRDKRADLLCEATTVTLGRRELVDFSLPTFIDGGSLILRAGGPDSLPKMAGSKVGVLAGTTTERALRDALRGMGVDAAVVLVSTHREGLALLDGEKITAYFADRAILAFLMPDSTAPGQLRIADQYLTAEPYAFAMRRGDNEFRLAVDRALSQIYRSGEIASLWRDAFGPDIKPSQILESLYLIAALPD